MPTDEASAEQTFAAGFNNFCAELERDPAKAEAFRELVELGQNPNVMVISCSDSRVVPEIIFQANLGDAFGTRCVAALVPPYDSDSAASNHVAGAVEYAVNALGVEDIFIVGHTGCGGVGGLVNAIQSSKGKPDYPFTDCEKWVMQAKDVACSAEDAEFVDQDLVDRIGRNMIVWSAENLKTYPSVQKGIENGTLHVHAWQFDKRNLKILKYDEVSGDFNPIASANPDDFCCG